MKIQAQLTEDEIRAIISTWINDNYNISIPPQKVNIQVKSKQNYRSEWETAAIRVDIDFTK